MTIVPISEKLKNKPDRKPNESIYKWYTIEVGQAFIIDANKLKYGSLVSMAHKMSKKLDCRFKVMLHVGPLTINGVDYPYGVYEVGKFNAKNEIMSLSKAINKFMDEPTSEAIAEFEKMKD